MSLATWKSEFYPKPASKTCAETALDEALLKWEGLTPDNLRKHELILEEYTIKDRQILGVDGESLEIDGESCSLCSLYRSYRAGDCTHCPLFLVRNGFRCDEGIYQEGLYKFDHAPYTEFEGGNAAPMIRWLKAAKQLVQITKSAVGAQDV